MRRGAKPGTGKVEPKPPVARKSLKNEGSRVRQLRKRLEEALKREAEAFEQQTATAEILRVMSSSLAQLQPVLDAIAERAARLCDASNATIILSDGDALRMEAHHGPLAEQIGTKLPIDRRSVSGRAFIEGHPLHVDDLSESGDFPLGRQMAAHFGIRTFLAVPLVREAVPIGLITMQRTEIRPFSPKQIELLKTFADQAVIAIENVRLVTELQQKNHSLTEAHARVSEALDQQTATSELLKVIGRSTFDLQPVFETLVENARRLCEAELAFAHRFDGQVLRVVATHNVSPELRAFVEQNPFPIGRHTVMARAGLERRTIHMHDVQSDPEITYPGNVIEPVRSALAVPMLRGAALLGVIMVYRHEVRPFSDSQIALLETFADQAAIAIENARLLTELQARTQELSRSVSELRALGEVGRAISSTLDLQTVLSTIVARATQLAGTDAGVIYEYDEQREVFVPRASEHLETEIVETMLATPVRKGEGATGQLAEAREPIQVPDMLEAPAESRVRGALVRAGYRALLAVPLVREDHLIGGLTVIRKTTGEFAPEVIDLLRTFATQSALAIQNARLFREIEQKSRELEAASRHKSEFMANMSHELRTPLNAIIGYSELLEEDAADLDGGRLVPDLQKIATAAKHQLSLINDVLDLSKIEAGRMELELSEFDLPNAIDNALILVRERASRRGITLGRAIDERLGTLRGDERKVKQVLLNLLSNALKFTPEGGRIDVSARVHDEVAEVSVADTGVGIAPEDQEVVFEEFRQVGTADKKVEGTGLGLALSRKFIELHGGRIWVKSQVGQGSTFTFTLPVRREE